MAGKKSYLDHEKDHLRRIFRDILGSRLVSLEIEELDGELYPCLVFEDEYRRVRHIAIVYRDAEANGPGWVKIAKEDEVVEAAGTEGGKDEYHGGPN